MNSLGLVTCMTFLLVTTTLAQNTNSGDPLSDSPSDSPSDSSPRPNIIYIMADDLGFADVQWETPEILTPNLQALAEEGMILRKSYMQTICTPSRSALMTGYYPIRVGRQTAVFRLTEPAGLFKNATLMPEYLSQLDYKSYIIGKWHLGSCSVDYLPNKRGFDTFDGFLLGREDYFTHYLSANVGDQTPGYTFYKTVDGELVPDFTPETMYITDTIALKSNQTIDTHVCKHPDKPFFLWLTHQVPNIPLKAPKRYLDMYPDVQDENRRIYSAMVTALDDSVGSTVRKLKELGLYDNTIIIFSGDNGGDFTRGASNGGLRGQKISIFEGGVRQSAIIKAPHLEKTNITWNGLIHVTDWLPTLVAAAGGDASILPSNLDGINLWESLRKGDDGTSPDSEDLPRRTEFLYNISPIQSFLGVRNHCGAAVRVGKWKLIAGYPGRDSINATDRKSPVENPGPEGVGATNRNSQITYNCDIGDPNTDFLLFDLDVDPNEKNDLSATNPAKVQELLDRIDQYAAEGMVPPYLFNEIEAGNPNNFLNEDGIPIWGIGWCPDSL